MNRKNIIPLVPINDGAQILQRVTEKLIDIDIKRLIEEGFKVIIYKNTKLNDDLLRIQSIQGIMETHNKFNVRGKRILNQLEIKA